MVTTMTELLCCPVCLDSGFSGSTQAAENPLVFGQGSWRCLHGHQFDQARQGYINVLPAQHKRSKDPGDSKAMVQARRRFLEQGFYQPLADAIERLLQCVAEQGGVLDAGCGEGYYLRQLAAKRPGLQLLGNDISKWAVRAAAPWHKTATYLVASNARVPLTSGSLDAIICAFGFAVDNEFLRLLKPTGYLLKVDPASGHLNELRQVLYNNPREAEAESTNSRPGWQLIESERLCFSVELPSKDSIQDLVAMTPHQHKAGREGLERLSALTSMTVTVDILLNLYQPHSIHSINEGTGL
ncbi:rRNA (guanine-N1)-methyltransferase [Aliidiomarina soli]|uniref:rRNA (Guanine-N1)-methyltransferase n=2 Tax=Aliidiomarina soli TaxID=1928574 RepID=A0A432WH58_9GAMM|nr:rRNA (guanine-N1)-methyltransferase [Aliidiomarina soli]